MGVKETIKTWKWRIIKAGFKLQDFAAAVEIPQGQISNYCAGRIVPSLERFDIIEGKLKELGV